MLLATDVQYTTQAGKDSAIAAALLFADWSSATAERTFTRAINNIAPYEPGFFYKRELPCLLALLAALDLADLEAIVIDGYVTLGAGARAGLGLHLYEALQGRVPVVGVAKNRFAGTPKACEILRGTSQSPLFVTAVGIPLAVAKTLVVNMHGEYRFPTLLKQVDQCCRRLIS